MKAEVSPIKFSSQKTRCYSCEAGKSNCLHHYFPEKKEVLAELPQSPQEKNKNNQKKIRL